MALSAGHSTLVRTSNALLTPAVGSPPSLCWRKSMPGKVTKLPPIFKHSNRHCKARGVSGTVANSAPVADAGLDSARLESLANIDGGVSAEKRENTFVDGIVREGLVNAAVSDVDSEVGVVDEDSVVLEEQNFQSDAIAENADVTDEIRIRQEIAEEVSRRKNFAIISHPDAGKTTLTEKLLLYGGAIHEAGTVKARRASRHATSDWMDLEKQRGISITSTAMVFETKGKQINLLDTPGHQDFGEDTFRTLSAADNAVMLVDGGKGLEPQTKKLFEVCRMRKLPIFTFMNKMDRPSLEPLDLIDEIEKEFHLATFPVNWPIGSGDRFKGVYDRLRKEVHLFSRDSNHGKKETLSQIMRLDDPQLPKIIESDVFLQFQEEVELLDELCHPFDIEKVHGGELTLVFFGSAMNNFGVELFLESFLEYSVPPSPHDSSIGIIEPSYPHFSGFVFKLQANMDPKHRDKVAFIRVCSGKFKKGMKVQIARTNKTVALSRPQKLFAQERSIVDDGYAGDVIGLNNPNCFAIGDTVYVGPQLTFAPIPSFSPELFCYLKNPNPSKYKQFLKGINELLGEGAVQVLYSVEGRSDPILAAIGQLQFEVVQYRMENEYGVSTSLEPLGFSVARWVSGGWDALQSCGRLFNCNTVKDQWDRPVLLFRNEWNVTQLLNDHPEIGELSPYALPPVEVLKK